MYVSKIKARNRRLNRAELAAFFPWDVQRSGQASNTGPATRRECAPCTQERRAPAPPCTYLSHTWKSSVPRQVSELAAVFADRPFPEAWCVGGYAFSRCKWRTADEEPRGRHHQMRSANGLTHWSGSLRQPCFIVIEFSCFA